jgi:cytochrome c oxidase assembly protein subunit 15
MSMPPQVRVPHASHLRHVSAATSAVEGNAQRSTRAAARFAIITLSFFILVVLWGAVVRASGSGGGCGASWPLCNGDFFPHHPRLATIIEFVHRSTSGICTILDLVLIVWTFTVTPRRHPARAAVLWSAAFLILEAGFGAVLVLRHYVENNISTGRIVMQCIHFTNTLLLMASLALVVWFLSASRTTLAIRHSPKSVAWLSVVSSIIVGATGSLAALADTLFPSPTLRAALASDFAASSPLLVRMRWMHPAAAVIAFICVLLLARAGTRTARIVLGLMLLQFVLGIADVLLLAPTWMQVLHLLGADLYWVGLIVLAAQSLWPTTDQSLEVADEKSALAAVGL